MTEVLVKETDLIDKRKKNFNKLILGWVKDNYDKLFLFILLLAFIVRVWVFLKTKDQAIWWDAADYLATAKRWAGLNPNLIDMWYYRRGFFWPLFCSIFFRIGLGELTIRFFVILFSTGIVATSYFLIKEMFNKKLAILVSLCVTFSWVFLFFSGRPLTNLPATFFLLLSVLFFWKGYVLKQKNKFIYFFALFFAIACLTRMQYLMFALPIFVLIFTKEKFKFLKNKQLWIAVGIIALIFLPQLILQSMHFGNPILDLITYYLGIGGSASGEVGVQLAKTSDLFVYFTNLPYMLDGNSAGYSSLFVLSPIYILFIIGIFPFFSNLFFGFDKIFKNEEVQKKFFIFIWIVSTFLFLGYIAPHLEQRYAMQTLPFLFVIAMQPLIYIHNFLSKKFNLKKTLTFFIILLALLLFLSPNFSSGKNIIEAKLTSYSEVKQAGLWIKANSNPEDIVVSASLPQTTYYSERSTQTFTVSYRRDMAPENESGFEKFVQEKHPKYMIISIFERHSEWAYTYPEKHPELLTPVKVYSQNDQPVLVIYEFNTDLENI